MTSRHLSEIATKIDQWEDLVPHLNIPDEEVERIRLEENDSSHKRRFLEKWRELFGINATYQILMEAAEASGKRDLASSIQRLGTTLYIPGQYSETSE